MKIKTLIADLKVWEEEGYKEILMRDWETKKNFSNLRITPDGDSKTNIVLS